MSDRPRPKPKNVNSITWPQFVDLVMRERGATLHTTKAPVAGQQEPGRYLLRAQDEKEYVCHLPQNMDEDQRMGVWGFEAACRSLNISTRFEGLPIIL